MGLGLCHAHRPVTLAVLLGASLAPAAAPAFADEQAPTPGPAGPFVESSRRVTVHLSFAHWFSRAVGQPDGYLTPSIAVGVRPGVRNLELCARYTVAPGRLTLESGTRSVVGFVSLEVLGSRELRAGSQSLRLFAGPLGTLVHTESSSVGYGLGLTLGADLTFGVSARGDLFVGPFFAVRGLYYTLPGDATPPGLSDGWHRDAQIDIGVAASFL